MFYELSCLLRTQLNLILLHSLQNSFIAKQAQAFLIIYIISTVNRLFHSVILPVNFKLFQKSLMYRSAILIALFLWSCQPQQPTGVVANQPQEKLIYIASRGEGFNLYTRDLTTGVEMPFTTAPGWEWAPQYIAEENVVLYNSQDTSGNFQMMAVDLDGQEAGFAIPDLPDFVVSPDGKRGIFSRKNGDASLLKLVSLNDLSDSLLITPDSAYHGRVKWSMDSKNLAYISDKSGSNEVYWYQLTGKVSKQLTNNEQREKYLSWSPDGNQIAVTIRTDSTENDIVLIDVKTLSVTTLTDTPINESEIAWSPSGRYLAYHAQVNEEDDIYLLNLETKVIQKVTAGKGYHGEPAWIWE